MVLIPGLPDDPKLVSIPKVPSLLAMLTFPPVAGFAVNECNEKIRSYNLEKKMLIKKVNNCLEKYAVYES